MSPLLAELHRQRADPVRPVLGAQRGRGKTLRVSAREELVIRVLAGPGSSPGWVLASGSWITAEMSRTSRPATPGGSARSMPPDLLRRQVAGAWPAARGGRHARECERRLLRPLERDTAASARQGRSGEDTTMNKPTHSRRALLRRGILLGASTWIGTAACSAPESPEPTLETITPEQTSLTGADGRRHCAADAAGVLLPGRGEPLLRRPPAPGGRQHRGAGPHDQRAHRLRCPPHRRRGSVPGRLRRDRGAKRR